MDANNSFPHKLVNLLSLQFFTRLPRILTTTVRAQYELPTDLCPSLPLVKLLVVGNLLAAFLLKECQKLLSRS